MENLKLLIAGEGGQGVQTIGEILAQTAFTEGNEVSLIPNFGVEQRGGVSLAFLQISREKPIAYPSAAPTSFAYPKFKKADILVVLAGRAISRVNRYVGENTIYVYDSTLIPLEALPIKKCNPTSAVCPFPHIVCNFNKIFSLPALDMASKKLAPGVFNMVILGSLLALTHIVKNKDIKEVVDETLAHKFRAHPNLQKLDHEALQMGLASVKEQYVSQVNCIKVS